MKYQPFKIWADYNGRRMRFCIKVIEWSPIKQIYQITGTNRTLELERHPVKKLEGPEVFYPHWKSNEQVAPAAFKVAVAIEIDRYLLL